MRILRKDEVQSAKSLEKKVEIEQGLRIAKKIDELRETSVREEQNLQKFKNETAKIVQQDIDSLIKKKETLEYEIGVLEKQNINLKKPFDEEWELMKTQRLSDLDKKLEDLESRENKLKKGEFEFELREKELKISEDRMADEHFRSEKKLKEAIIKEEEAQRMVNEAKLKEAQINSEIDAKTNAFNKKEAEWKVKELDLNMREEALKRSVVELARREIFINDKYRTLLKTEQAVKIKE